MSDLAPALTTCPRCRGQQSATLFTSLNADLVAAQYAAVLDGTFELTTCAACAHPFRPEHNLLYTHLAAHTWIVVYPVSARADFPMLERAVASALDRELGAAPAAVARLLAGVRRRLVFGQHALTEAARVHAAGLDPSLLECAKLFAFRDHLARLMPLGPVELCFERRDEQGELTLGVHALDSGERKAQLTVERGALAELRTLQPELEARYPELFTALYLSACRYLYVGMSNG